MKFNGGEVLQIIGFRSWLTFCLWLSVVGAAVAEPPNEKPSVERLKADVYYLASDTLEGRGIATPGIELAAQHIRTEFKRLGLHSGTPDGSYYQPFRYGESSKSQGTLLHNVVGVLEGKGIVANETIIIGAHYDHLGYGQINSAEPGGRRGRIYPGADDNASGTAAMLELARRFATRTPLLRRRLVFMAFCAEESGTIGSQYYASKNPLFPIKETVAMLNFDMVGRLRNEELGIAGNKSAREFDGVLTRANAKHIVNLLLGGPEIPGNSDHIAFINVRVPILFFCTGTHPDHHAPTDTADKIN